MSKHKQYCIEFMCVCSASGLITLLLIGLLHNGLDDLLDYIAFGIGTYYVLCYALWTLVILVERLIEVMKEWKKKGSCTLSKWRSKLMITR